MKTIVIIIGLALCVPVFTACKTTTNPSGVVSVGGQQIDPQATGRAVQIAAKYGALETIRQKPESREYFRLAGLAISTVIANGDYRPETVTSALNSLTGNAEVSGAIADALGLYQDFFGKLVTNKLDAQSPYTVPVLVGLAAGIQQAIAMTEPTVLF